ncbi:hypothetical protein H0486_18070 [Lachnospiraceae bacterium MD1]|uniref:Uncharacterized protein n=1 Tax=Variimorphobacter saccharofermentans TaxID=2755051 RepID=A0A839K4D9_9FIRM|nr:hypothetical protein [Variimorphobacter saccharofermentans]MBB2184765.1 hypothetical protein [Variimorphobacter saccharofermentans]
MAVTYTQVPVKLEINKNTLASVIDVLEMINGSNPNKIYTIETSFHVGNIAQADTVMTGIETLKNLGALSTYQADSAFRQIDGFKRSYLK